MDEELNNENIVQLNQSIADLQRLMAQQAGLMSQQNRLMAISLTETQKQQLNLAEFGGTISEDDKILQAHIKQVELTNQRLIALRGAVDNVSMGAKSLYNALTEAGGGVTKYKGALDGLGGAVDSLIKGFGPGNKAFNLGLQAAAKALFGMTGLVLEQTQYMIKSMDTVAGLGVTSGLTANQLRLLGENAGYSWKNLEKFATYVQKAGRDLVAFGGTSTLGVAAFTRFVSIGDDQYKKFRALGLEQEQVTELMTDLAKIQIQSGQATGRGATAMDRLQNGTLKLLENMLALADVTGVSVEEQKRGMQFAAQNRNFQFYAARESMRAAEIRRTRGAEGEAEAAAIEARVAGKRALAGLIREEFGQEIATGFLQRAAGTKTGALTEESVPLDLLLRFQGGARKFVDAINEATTPEDVQKAQVNLRAALLNSTEQQLKLGKAYEGLGKAEVEYMNTFGVFTEGTETFVRNLDPDAAGKTVTELGDSFNNKLNAALERIKALTDSQGNFVGKVNDNIMNAAARIAAYERWATKKLATVIAAMNPLIGNAGQAASKLLAVSIAAGLATAALTAFAYKMMRTGPGGNVPPGTPAPTTPGTGGRIERRTDRRGREYYVDTETGKRASREAFEEAERAAASRGSLGGRIRGAVRPGSLKPGIAGLALSLGMPYLVDALGGEGSTAGALANIGASTAGMAMTGSMFGPIGTLIGGVGGLGMGLYQSGGTLFKNLFGKKDDFEQRAEESQADEELANLEELINGQNSTGRSTKDLVDLGQEQLDLLGKINGNILGSGTLRFDQPGMMGQGGDQGGWAVAGEEAHHQDIAQDFIKQGGSITKDKVTDKDGKVLWSSDDKFLKAMSARMKTEMRYMRDSEIRQEYERERRGLQKSKYIGADARTQDYETYKKNVETPYLDAETGLMSRVSIAFKTGTDTTGQGGGYMRGDPIAPTATGLNFNARGQFEYKNEKPSTGTRPDTANNLTSVSSASGASASVDAKFKNQFQGLISELESSGYKISRIDGYNNRNIAGTNTPSAHAFGAAIDINPETNMPGSRGDLPFNAGQIAAKYGLGWGGAWSSKTDPMHFSALSREGGSFMARYGAYLEGPMSGFRPDITFHGNEIISPAPRDSILQKYFTEPATSENQPASAFDMSTLMNNQNMTFKELIRIQSDQLDKQKAVIDKLQTVADTLQTSQRTQSEILKYTKS